jgi:hypothetical protein
MAHARHEIVEASPLNAWQDCLDKMCVARNPVRCVSTATLEDNIMAYPVLKMPIDGKWIGPAHGEAVSNPADGSIIAKLPHATRDNLDEALAAAECGFRTWRRFSQKFDTATGDRRAAAPAGASAPADQTGGE